MNIKSKLKKNNKKRTFFLYWSKGADGIHCNTIGGHLIRKLFLVDAPRAYMFLVHWRKAIISCSLFVYSKNKSFGSMRKKKYFENTQSRVILIICFYAGMDKH